MWTACWSSSCWEHKCGVVPTKICSKDCRAGCRCADGFARNGTACINETTCPSNAPDPAAFSSFVSTNNFNQTARACGQGEVWTQCSSSSCFEHRCGSKPSLLCTRDCRMGCKCAEGWARLGDQCVNETQCITSRSLHLGGKLGKRGGKKRHSIQPTVGPTSVPTVASEVMFVGPYRQQCEGNEGSKCLVTKSVKASEFQANVISIDGFDFVPGYDYKLRVTPQRVQAGEIKYVLVSIATKTASLQQKPHNNQTLSPSQCAEVICMVFCDNGYKKDDQGCEICSCLPAPTVQTCPDVTCDNLCPAGYQRNAAGCATCNCAPVPTTLIPPLAYDCNSAADWTLAKVAGCCVPLPPVGSTASNLCQTGFQSGFLSLR